MLAAETVRAALALEPDDNGVPPRMQRKRKALKPAAPSYALEVTALKPPFLRGARLAVSRALTGDWLEDQDGKGEEAANSARSTAAEVNWWDAEMKKGCKRPLALPDGCDS